MLLIYGIVIGLATAYILSTIKEYYEDYKEYRAYMYELTGSDPEYWWNK